MPNKFIKYARIAHTTGKTLGASPAVYEARTTKRGVRLPMKFKNSVKLMVCFAALSGCGDMRTYDGTPKKRDEIAVLRTAGHTYIASVDDTLSGRSLLFRSSIELLPGRHAIRVGEAQGYDTCSIAFNAVAGMTYLIIEQKGGNVWSAFLRPYKQDEPVPAVITFDGKALQRGRDIECKF